MSTAEHLKMFECLIDTGADVLRNLSEIRLLDNQKKSLVKFLEDERHYFYHQYQQKTLCCECSPHGCTIISTGKIESHIFNKVYYYDAKRRIKGHFVKNGMHDPQKCIHAFNPRNIKMDDLDLSALNYFLWTKGALSSQETSALKIIMDTRSRVCHPSSTTSIGLPEINHMWAMLENAILDLSQPERYKNMTKKYIKSLREKQKIETENILHGVNQIKETVKDELIKTRTNMMDEGKKQTKLMGQLIGFFQNLSVIAQASPQVVNDRQASGVDGQINMTTTLEIPSLPQEVQRQIVDTLPSELNVGSEDESIKIDAKQVKSIVLDLIVSPSIFRDTDTLRSALMSVVREIVDKGKMDTTVREEIYITLKLNSPLSSQETEVLTGVFAPKKLDISDVESEGRIHNYPPGEPIDDEQGVKYSCNICQQKDNQILELGNKNGKLKESIWKLRRFVHDIDPETMEETVIEDSDYMSFQLSEEAWGEESNVDSGYMTYQSSGLSEIPTNPEIETMDYYSKIARVILTVFPDIFKDIVESKISPKQLYRMFLPRNRGLLQQELGELQEMNCSNSFDSLSQLFLYKILRQFSLVPTPAKGWGRFPSKEDIGISDDVERMRRLRNEFVHRRCSAFQNSELYEYVSQFRAIGQRVDSYFSQHTCYEQKITSYMTSNSAFSIHDQVKYEKALRDIESLKQEFESRQIKIYWSDSYESNLRNLRQVIKDQKTQGEKKFRVQIIFQGEEDIEQNIGVLNALKEEITEAVNGIDLVVASKE